MKFKKVIMSFMAVGILVFAGAKAIEAMQIAVPEEAEKAQAEQSNIAPDFSLPDANGEMVTLSNYLGKVVVLEWVNFGCPYVQKHYKSGNMQALQEKYTAQDVVWLSINSSAQGKQGQFEGDELLSQIADNGNVATHYLVDTSGDVGQLYGAKTTPHMFVIDENGKFIYQGAIDSVPSAEQSDIEQAENYVVSALDSHMAGEDVKTSKSQPYGCGVKY